MKFKNKLYIMKSIVDKVKKFFGSDKESAEKTNNSLNEELVKGEISELIDQIDAHDEHYSELKESTKDALEKSEDGEYLRGKMESRYKSKKNDLIKALGEKKKELRDILEKGKKAQDYGDSIVRNADGDILMLLRKNDDGFEPNKWGLPGGKIEPGESPGEGAKRELLEEAALTAESCYPIGIKSLKDGGKIHYYDVHVVEGDAQIALDEEEHCNYCFMSLNEIKQRRPEEFIMELKTTLLELLDPKYEHVQILRKGFEADLIGIDEMSKALSQFKGARFTKEQESA